MSLGLRCPKLALKVRGNCISASSNRQQVLGMTEAVASAISAAFVSAWNLIASGPFDRRRAIFSCTPHPICGGAMMAMASHIHRKRGLGADRAAVGAVIGAQAAVLPEAVRHGRSARRVKSLLPPVVSLALWANKSCSLRMKVLYRATASKSIF